jgi:hypothetical protein
MREALHVAVDFIEWGAGDVERLQGGVQVKAGDRLLVSCFPSVCTRTNQQLRRNEAVPRLFMTLFSTSVPPVVSGAALPVTCLLYITGIHRQRPFSPLRHLALQLQPALIVGTKDEYWSFALRFSATLPQKKAREALSVIRRKIFFPAINHTFKGSPVPSWATTGSCKPC